MLSSRETTAPAGFSFNRLDKRDKPYIDDSLITVVRALTPNPPLAESPAASETALDAQARRRKTAAIEKAATAPSVTEFDRYDICLLKPVAP